MNNLPIENPGAIDMPFDERDYRLDLGGAPAYPAKFTNEKAWKLPIFDQKKQPACGAHAGAFLSMVMDSKPAAHYTPRYTWAHIKTFDGHPIADGTDMRAIMKSLTTGLLDFDDLGNDVSLPLNEYASPVLLTHARQDKAAPNRMGLYGFANPSFEELKALIHKHKAVIILVRMGNEWYRNKSGVSGRTEKDILPLRTPNPIISGHFVVAHSYDEKYIYFANSFGTKWGRKGHGYFGANYMPFVNAVGTVADYAEAVVVPTPKESMEFKEGGRSPLIAKFQQILKDLKFFPADTETTGYYGTITKEAYAKFVANTGFTLSPAPTGKGAETDIMDMETKSLFRSRTFWFAVATFVAGVLTLANETFKDVLTPEMAGALLMAVSVINGALRLMTHTAVR